MNKRIFLIGGIVAIAIIAMMVMAIQLYDKKDEEIVSHDKENISLNLVEDENMNEETEQYYKGFDVIGTIEIPKTNVIQPILSKLTTKTLETGVFALYPSNPKLNEVGNVVIAGNNYKDGTFFSDNKLLEKGDEIHITDINKNKVVYEIYKTFETTDIDTSFYARETNGKKEITLTTISDKSPEIRLIILAKEK
ncbi:MAG: sortase [Clostridia bacterium]|nr:sortase [Clostridia bacterium]